jgi:hypothetical protein
VGFWGEGREPCQRSRECSTGVDGVEVSRDTVKAELCIASRMEGLGEGRERVL